MKLLYVHHVPLDSFRANVLQVLHMCHAFQAAGQDVTLAVPGSKQRGAEALADSVAEELGTQPRFAIRTFGTFGIAGRPATWGSVPGVRKLLAELQDVDACYVRAPLFLHLALSKRIPTIFESHHDQLHPSVSWIDAWYRKLVLDAAKHPQFLGMVAISEALARRWEDFGMPRHKIQVLHDGVAEDFYQSPKTRAEARRNLGLPVERSTVVYTGNLGGDRGVGAILDLAETLPEASFLIVGGRPSEVTALAKEAKGRRLGNLTLTGRVPHRLVSEYVQAADVVLALWGPDVPTIQVCSPMKLFEYMASGRIIVGYGFPTIREVLADGDTAFLVEPGDVDELRKRVVRGLALGYPNPIASAARNLALSEYTWARRAERILKLVGVEAAC